MSALSSPAGGGRLYDPRPSPGTDLLDRIGLLYLVFSITFLVSSPFILGSQEKLLNDPSLILTSGEGDVLKQVALLAIYSVGGLLLLMRFPVRFLLFLGLPLLFLAILCVASLAWSVNPAGTLRRLVALFGTVGVGLYAGLRLDVRSFLRLMTVVGGIVLVSSLVISLVMPQAGLDPEGRLRGVFFHKNYTASFSALTFMVAMVRLIGGAYRGLLDKGVLVLLAVLSVACIVLSKSAGPIPALAAALGAMLVLYLGRTSDGRFRALLPVLVTIGVVSVAVVLLTFGGALFGRSDDLSGRTEVWIFALSMIDKQLWLGYGYGVFWLGADAPGAAFWEASDNFVPHAHNGYLQLALDSGVIGVACWLGALVTMAAKTIALLRRTGDACLYWVISYVVFYAVINLGESDAWGPNDLHTLLLAFVVVRCNVEYARHRRPMKRRGEAFGTGRVQAQS